MDLRDFEEHKVFRQEVRDFIAAHRDKAPSVTAQSFRLRPRPYDEDVLVWQKLLVQHGLACRTVPREYGGYGGEPDILKTQIIADEFFAEGLPQSLKGQGIGMLVPTLLEHGTQEQKQEWIEKTILGEVFWCQGYSEPGAGSDLASLKTSAIEDSDDFIINGQKIWTSSAQVAQMIFCLVRTEADQPRHRGISYLIFPMDLPGIEVRPIMTMTGQPSFNEVFFTDVRVPKSALVGGRGQGWTVANSTLKHERGMLGNSQDLAARLNHLKEQIARLKAKDRLPMDIAVLRDRFAELYTQVEGLRLHEARMNSLAVKGESGGVGDMVFKLLGCEISYQLDLLGIDLMGEGGAVYDPMAELTTDNAWHQLAMYDLGLLIGGGTTQIQKNIISERGLGMPREVRPA